MLYIIGGFYLLSILCKVDMHLIIFLDDCSLCIYCIRQWCICSCLGYVSWLFFLCGSFVLSRYLPSNRFLCFVGNESEVLLFWSTGICQIILIWSICLTCNTWNIPATTGRFGFELKNVSYSRTVACKATPCSWTYATTNLATRKLWSN
jgi:hypothetical protein